MAKDYFSHLSSEEKHILKDKGTEVSFTGEYNDFYEAGVFVCRACKNPLYESNTNLILVVDGHLLMMKWQVQ